MDLILSVENMLPAGKKRRQYYLGIDFVREGTNLPKLEIWQEKLLEHYPDLAERALVPEGHINLLPEDAISLRIHSVGGWGAITMGKNVVMTGFELAGLNVKANPKYGSEKKGQPTTFYGVMSRQPLRLNGELKFVNVVLSPDPNVFRNSNPLAGMQPGGVFVIQSDHEPEVLWASLPPQARQFIQENDVKVFAVDAFKIATEEATDPDLRYRMQGTAFMGAFFRTSPFMEAEGLDEETLFEGMRKQLQKKFGHLGERVVDANLQVIRRGFDEVKVVHVQGELVGAGQVMAEAAVGQIPTLLDHPDQDWGIANQGRFWEQVCSLCGIDQDVIADPFSAISAIPAATSTVRDMSDIRFEIPEFIASKCTGCAQCWTQCPDAAIPGLVNSVEDVIQTAIKTAQNGKPLDRIQSVSANLAREAHKVLKAVPFQTFGDTVLDRLRQPGREAAVGRGAQEGAGRGVRRRVLGAVGLPARQDRSVLRSAREQGEGRRRAAVDHREPGSLQGLQHLRGRVRGRGAGDRAAGRGEPGPAAAELEAVGEPARHGRPVHQHPEPGRGHRRPPVASPQEGELPHHGGRRRGLHGLR